MNVAFPVNTVILLFILALIVWFFAVLLRKCTSGLKLMLMGLSVTLFGSILAVDPGSSLGGIEYLIAFSGLVISAAGLSKDG